MIHIQKTREALERLFKEIPQLKIKNGCELYYKEIKQNDKE